MPANHPLSPKQIAALVTMTVIMLLTVMVLITPVDQSTAARMTTIDSITARLIIDGDRP